MPGLTGVLFMNRSLNSQRRQNAVSHDAWSRNALDSNLLDNLKADFRRQHIAGTNDPELQQHLHRAMAESVSIAWTTPFPLLFLPELLAEKGRQATAQFERQRAIRARSQPKLSFAA